MALDRPYVSARTVSKILGIAPERVSRVAEASNIRRRRLPGMHRTQYHIGDARRVAEMSVMGAEPAVASAGA